MTDEAIEKMRREFHVLTGVWLDGMEVPLLLAGALAGLSEGQARKLLMDGEHGSGVALFESMARATRLQAQAFEMVRDIAVKRHAAIVRRTRDHCISGDGGAAATDSQT